MWIGGSFVSDKSDPGDIDVTYLIEARMFDALDPETLTDLTDLTMADLCREQDMRVDALILRLPDRLPVSQMAPSLLQDKAGTSFRDIGLRDEVLQCIKPEFVHSTPGEQRRGYVEVLL
ncbi:hypothetical protein SUDANB148_04067 [Streptomyces sp. SudanB148_2056]